MYRLDRGWNHYPIPRSVDRLFFVEEDFPLSGRIKSKGGEIVILLHTWEDDEQEFHCVCLTHYGVRLFPHVSILRLGREIAKTS
jgi:hypothetical protein